MQSETTINVFQRLLETREEQGQDVATRERHTGVDGNGLRKTDKQARGERVSRRRISTDARRDGDALRGKGEADGV